MNERANQRINRTCSSRLRLLAQAGYAQRYAPHGIQSELRYSAPLFAPARQFAWRLSGNTKNTERKGMRGPLVLWRAASHRAAGQSSCVCERRPPVRWRSAHHRAAPSSRCLPPCVGASSLPADGSQRAQMHQPRMSWYTCAHPLSSRAPQTSKVLVPRLAASKNQRSARTDSTPQAKCGGHRFAFH